MRTVYVADTGLFVRCGGPDNEKFQRLRRAVRQAGVVLQIPQRVYDELGGDSAAEVYPSGGTPYDDGIEAGWIVVADDLDYTNPVVSTVMDETRRFVANETDRDEDVVETADAALVGLAAQLLDSGVADEVVLLTTDKPAGRAAETLLPNHGFENQIQFQYVSVDFLEGLTASDFE